MRVRVFSTSTCPWCDRAKDYLKDLGIAYESVDVRENREMAMEMVRKTHQRGVPVVQIGESYIIGFDRPQIDAALKTAGLLTENSF